MARTVTAACGDRRPATSAMLTHQAASNQQSARSFSLDRLAAPWCAPQVQLDASFIDRCNRPAAPAQG
jgi:hypothetical protein